MAKLAIFDLDGTLIHFPFTYLFDETIRILKLFGHPDVPRVDLESAFSSFDYFRVVQSNLKLCWDTEAQFQSKFWTEFNWVDYPKAEIFSDTISILTALKQAGYLIAIATARATSVTHFLGHFCGYGSALPRNDSNNSGNLCSRLSSPFPKKLG